jgi:hypothetical protein
MKQRGKTLPPRLKKVSEEIGDAIKEARKIQEMSVQEEVLVELEKVNSALEQAKKEITRIMKVE